MTPRIRTRRGCRAAALAMVLAVVGAVLLIGGAGGATAAGTPSSAVTVKADAIKKGATVTVSKTKDLGYEAIQVSWRGFPTQLSGSREFLLYQCKANPTSSGDCYGSNTGQGSPLGGSNGYGPDGAGNRVTAITNTDGTGSANFVVETAQQLSTLGCNAATPCSLVVWDTGDTPEGATTPWAPHVTIPLTFKPALETCPLKDAAFSVEGAPMANLAMLSWTAAACLATPSTTVAYSLLGDSQARGDFIAKSTDVALTTRPQDDVGERPHRYAPLAASAISIGYVLDDPVTNKPVTGIRLNARLVAKLITESYPGLYGSDDAYRGPPACDPTANINSPSDAICRDPNTKGNPSTIFADKEFQALNAGLKVDWTDFLSQNFFQPVLAGDNQDLTYELTRWLMSDPDAKAFLSGTPDQYETHVNTSYLTAVKSSGYTFPTGSIRSVDNTTALQFNFFPLPGLDSVVKQATLTAPAGKDISRLDPGPPVSIPSYASQKQGVRSLFVIFDAADAQNLSMAQVAIKNAAGAFVTPTEASIAAGVTAMTKNADGTRQADFTAKDAAIYPLTTVQYAMVPTGGVPKAKAAKIADFIDLAAVKGQAHGSDNGQLPDGYLPLPADLTAQAVSVEAAVRSQSDTTGSPHPSPSLTTPGGGGLSGTQGGGSGSTSADGGTGGGGSGGSGGSTGGGGTAKQVSVTTLSTPGVNGTSTTTLKPVNESTGAGRYVLPIMLAVGVAAVGLGPVVVAVAGGAETGPRWVRSIARALPRLSK